MRLGKDYGGERLEAACTRALSFGGASYRCVHSILARGLDRKKPEDAADDTSLPLHENIRGGEYYH